MAFTSDELAAVAKAIVDDPNTESTLRNIIARLMAGELAVDSVSADELAHTAVTAGAYGDADHVAAFTVDPQGRLTAASDVATGAAKSADLASAAHGKGASMVSIEDIGACYAPGTTDVEEALHEVKDVADSAFAANPGNGAISLAMLDVTVADFSAGDLVQIGADTYEMLPAANTPVEIGATVADTTASLVAALAATAVQPADADTFAFGTVTFEWDDGGGVAGGNTPILIGLDAAASLAAAKVAIDGSAAVVPTDLDNPTIMAVPVQFHTTGNIPVAIGAAIVNTLANLATALSSGTEDVSGSAVGVHTLAIGYADAPGGTRVEGISTSIALPAPTCGGAAVAIWDASNLNETGCPVPNYAAQGFCTISAGKAAAIGSALPVSVGLCPFVPTANTVLTVNVAKSGGGVVAYTGTFGVVATTGIVVYTPAGATHPAAGDVVHWMLKTTI